MTSIAIVGASLAGIRTVEFLRRAKYRGDITLVGAEPHLPYDRPPLSKQVLRGEWEPQKLALRRKPYEDLNVSLRLGVRAIRLDTATRSVELDDGSEVPYQKLVVATGARVRTLPGQPALDGIHTLRTLDDALAIREAFAAGPRVVVIGAGFIGAEVAASAKSLGLDVNMIEAMDRPLARSLGPKLGEEIVALHASHGTKVVCGATVAGFLGDRRVESVALSDGTNIECDLVIVGIGVVPETTWLEGSGVVLENGVLCDQTCESSVPDVFAVGDVANWYNPLFEEHMRIEHWTNAVEQARHVAAAVLAAPGESPAFDSVPMFWSDQYDVKVQGVGRPRPGDDVRLFRDAGDASKLAALYGRAGRLVGAVTFNQPAKIIKLRKMIAQKASLEDGLPVVDA